MSARNSISLRITNGITKRSKNLRLSSANLSSSVHDAIYTSDIVLAAKIREWPTDVVAKYKEGIYIIQLALLGHTEEPMKVLSEEEMKTTTVQQIVDAAVESDRIQLLLSCQEEDRVKPEPLCIDQMDDQISNEAEEANVIEENDATSYEAPVKDSPSLAPSTSAMNRSGARFRITNTFTQKSKNMRIAPAMLNSSIFEAIYESEIVKTAQLLEWPPEIQQELTDKTMAVQIFVQEQGDKAFFIDDMKSTSVSHLLDDTGGQDGSIVNLMLRAVGLPKEDEEPQQEESTKNAETLSAEEKEARRKEEERRFWAEEEARLEAQAEERKRQKAAKLKAVMEAEEAAKQKARDEADAKVAERERAWNEKMNAAKAKKEAALEAEKDARMKAEEERKFYEEEEEKQQMEGLNQLKSRKRASIMLESAARGTNEARKARDEAAKAAEEAAKMEAEEEGKAVALLLGEEEEKELDARETESLLQSQEIDDLKIARDEQEARSMDRILESEEEKELEDREFSLLMKEEAQLNADLEAEYDREKANEEASRAVEEIAKRKEDDEIRKRNEEELAKIIATKEVQRKEEKAKKEQRRLQALELEALEREGETMPAKKADSPKDRTILWDENRKKRNGVAGRLQKVESMFVPDGRKRGPDVVPLSSNVALFIKKLRNVVAMTKDYQQARRQMEEARSKWCHDCTTMSKDSPLHKHVGEMLNPGQMADATKCDIMEFANTSNINSLTSVIQIASVHAKFSDVDYQEQVLDYATEWDTAVSKQAKEALELHRKLEQDVLHYESKVARLRQKAMDTENRGKLLSSKQAEKLNRNEMKLNDAAQIHEQEAGRICNLFEEITQHGWKDLYPLVLNTVAWEIERIEHEKATFGVALPSILKDMAATVREEMSLSVGDRVSPEAGGKTSLSVGKTSQEEAADKMSPEADTKADLKTELHAQQTENASLMRQMNKLDVALHESWQTKAELKQVFVENSFAMQLKD